MLPNLSKSLIIVLAMLQFFAPLVHAHTGANRFNQGLHIPGLEAYPTQQHSPVMQNVNADRDSEGMLVMIDAGIRSYQDVSVEYTGNHFYLPPADLPRIAAIPEFKCNFSPHLFPFHSSVNLASHSPRAPPAQ